ncbi:MAG: autotransporter assembly complex family protein [Rhodanobacteraceae bacterium]
MHSALRTKRPRPSTSARAAAAVTLTLFAATVAHAGKISLKVNGVDAALKNAVVAGVEISQYGKRDVSEAQAERLFDHAKAETKSALEPYGYYNVAVSGELQHNGDDFVALLKVDPGEPVKVTTLDIAVDGDANGQRAVRRAVAAFVPAKGQRFEHAQYEQSKAAVQAALFGSGYLDAGLATHRVDVNRANHSAEVHLHWEVGRRYRFGATTFSGGQFPDAFMARYIPWQEGDFYTQARLLEFQQRLVDADYFAIAQVRPDTQAAKNGIVPIEVTLAPAKRTIYTGGLFIGTDTGPGVRGGIKRRWVNRRGHKLGIEAIIAQRLKTLTALYKIPLPGQNNHSLNFGATYRDENTDTSQSRTFRLAANDSRAWHSWTRTIGLQFLTGDFTVADVKGSTTLLYPEVSLSRKDADNFNFPRRGYSLTFAARAGQKAIASSTSFAQITADAKWIHGLGKHSRFIARGTLGATRVDDFNKLPPELRFFAGGDRSIRGYTFQTIGPRNSDGKVIGGEDIAVASAEYEYYFSPHWGVATFVDAGDAFTGSNFDLKVGTGIGVRWRSPVGLVRVDLGVPVNDSRESGVALHIVIGPDL